jgi:hypothetical protein
MKTRFFLAVFAAAALLMCAGGPAFAQDHHEHHWDAKHPAFDDHEHTVVNGWWGNHHDHPVIGFRAEDRLPEGWAPRLRVGFVLDAGWRHRMHPLPADLYAELPPPPPHFAYYVIGGNVILVDRRDWHVADVISINL